MLLQNNIDVPGTIKSLEAIDCTSNHEEGSTGVTNVSNAIYSNIARTLQSELTNRFLNYPPEQGNLGQTLGIKPKISNEEILCNCRYVTCVYLALGGLGQFGTASGSFVRESNPSTATTFHFFSPL